jgi:hypothetical protein
MTWSLCDHHPGFDLPSSWPLASDSLVRQNFASKNQSPDDVRAKFGSWQSHDVVALRPSSGQRFTFGKARMTSEIVALP